jgi:deoxyribonuclease-4
LIGNLGAHTSAAGGVWKALERGAELACDAVQLFTRNQNQWRAKPLAEDAVSGFRRLAAGYRPEMLISHGSYLVNPASPEPATRERSVTALVDELERAERLGLAGAVLHPGSHVGAGVERGLARVSRFLDRVFRRTAGFRTLLLLETTAGQGSNLGSTFEELAGILDGVREPERLGICLDTCHLFAAGFPIHHRDGYRETRAALDTTIGLERVRAIHLNDSKMPFASRRDRHEHIGQGEIGLDAFRFIVNDPAFAQIPLVLETPKEGVGDAGNLELLRSLRA